MAEARGPRSDRLTGVDAAFLHQEVGHARMSVGGLATFDGPAPSITVLREHVEKRLHIVPRYRQRLVYPPAHLGRPAWADDPDFDVANHVRRAVLPDPGGEGELCELHARTFAQRLDRRRPLWELYLVEGLAGGRFAIIAKNHHALTDGISNIDVLNALWDLSPEPHPERDSDGSWEPSPEPSTAELTAAGVMGAASAPLQAARDALSAARNPRRALRRAGRALEGALEVAEAVTTPAPPTPFNVQVGPGRTFRRVLTDLDDFKRVKNAFGATINDVVLAVVAGAVERMLRARGIDARDERMRPIVPVSIRTEDQQYQLGNRVVTVRPSLPIGAPDPVERLGRVRREMGRIKRSTQPTVVEVLEELMNWAPEPVLGPVARLAFHPRLFNLLISNIPGPQFPLYLRGRKANDMVACGFLASQQTVAVAAVSYDGGLGFGLLADPDAVPDLDVFAEGITASLDELLEAADAAAPRAATLTGSP